MIISSILCDSTFQFLEVGNMLNRGYFTSDNEPDGIENTTHNTFAKLTWILT
jgi:hypothetical protein